MLLANASPLNAQIEFTQGDIITLTLVATDDFGNPVNLTGVSLATQILGANIIGPVTFPNGQHAILNQTTNTGQFTLALASADTASCGEGLNKQILTQATSAGASTFYRGVNILSVYAPVPVQ